jgi:hypothetical protein
MLRFVFPAALLSVLSAPAWAQSEEAPPAPVVRYAERSEVDFTEGVEVDGVLLRPDIAILHERQRAQFRPLFPIRVTFAHEMAESVEEVR